MTEMKSIRESALEEAKNALDRGQVNLGGSVHELAHLIYRKSNINPSKGEIL